MKCKCHGCTNVCARPLPNQALWAILCDLAPKDVRQRIEALPLANDATMKCRAWILLALQERMACMYLRALATDKERLGYGIASL